MSLPLAAPHSTYSIIATELRAQKLRVLVALGLFIAQALTVLVAPLLVGWVADRLINREEFSPGWVITLLIIVAIINGVLAWSSAYLLGHIAERILGNIRARFIRAALKLPRDVIDESHGDLLSRLSDDVDLVGNSLPNVLPSSISMALSGITVASGLGILDPRYILILPLLLPLLGLTMAWYMRTGPRTYAAERNAESQREKHLLDTFRAENTVLAFGIQQRQIERIRAASWEHVRWAMRTRIVTNILTGRLIMIEYIGLVAVLAIGVWVAIDGGSVGTILSGALLFMALMGPLSEFLMITDELQEGTTALRRIVGVVELADKSEASRAALEAPGTNRSSGDAQVDKDLTPPSFLVELRNAHFSYPTGPEVVRGVDLLIRDNEHVALVGVSGSGKSTLANLLAGHFPLQTGKRHTHLRNNEIFTIAQETHVFSSSLRDNLTLAADATDDELLAILDTLGATVLACAPDGLDTMLGSGGMSLSPAQGQQLALARVMVANPRLVILDEATAEAGSDEAEALEETAARVIQGRAALVIAHRLSQAMLCQRIIVMDQGRIIEQGTHDELLATGGRYAEAWMAGHGS